MAGTSHGSVAARPAEPKVSGRTADVEPQPAMRLDERIQWLCLHAMLFLVPLAIGNLTFLGIGGDIPLTFDRVDLAKVFVLRTLTLVSLAAWAVGMLVKGGRVRRTAADWIIVGFLAWVLLSSVFALHVPTAILGKYRRFEGLITFANYAAVYFLTVQIAVTPARIRSLLRTLILSAAVVAAYGLIQYVGGDFVDWGVLNFDAERSFATFGNPDMLGGFVVLTLPIALGLALTEPERQWRFVYWASVLMLATVLVTSFTRGAWIGAGVAILVVIVAARRFTIKIGPVDWGFIAAAAGGVAIVVVKSLRSTSDVLNVWTRLVSIFEFGEGSAATRFEIWDSAIAAIRESPLVGFGADSFRMVFSMFKTAEYVPLAGYQSVADNAHNYPLQLATGVGVPGALLLYAVIALALWRTAHGALAVSAPEGGDAAAASGSQPVAGTATRFGGEAGLVQAALWAATAGYVVHLMFGISVVGTSTVFWVFLGMLLAGQAGEVAVVAPRGTGLRQIATALVLIAVTAGLVANVVYVVADRYYVLGRTGPFDIQQRVRYLKTAAKLNPYSDLYRNEIGLAYINHVGGLVAQIRSVRASGDEPAALVSEARRYVSLAERACSDAIQFNPAEYENYLFLTLLYNIAGSELDSAYFERGIQVGRLGIRVQANGPAIRYELARALAATGKVSEAIEQLETATALDPNYWDALSELESLSADGRSTDATE